MESNDITLWLDGGWGVDALLGRQTRSHKDLDFAVQAKDVPKLRELLAERPFREKGEDYAKPFNYILVDDAGRELDLHIIELDAHGNGLYGGDSGESFTAHALSGRGTIGGHNVRCIAAEDVVRFHAGYDLKEKDFQDVSALCEAFGVELPAAYQRFVAH
jgi:lincosamide nucleotidyltransferase A/C/D/E